MSQLAAMFRARFRARFFPGPSIGQKPSSSPIPISMTPSLPPQAGERDGERGPFKRKSKINVGFARAGFWWRSPASPNHVLPAVRALLLGFALLGMLLPAQADDLDDAFAKLVEGRAYLKNFPKQETRRGLVEDFVGTGGHSPNRPVLQDAVQRAVAIRKAEPPEPASFPSGQPPRSILAKVIAWEALEAEATGYLYAGNRDLLDAIRVAYPERPGDPVDTRDMPKEEKTAFGLEFQKPLAYARLYFLQPIKDILSYVAADPTGALRAGGSINSALPHYVTFDEERDAVLPFPRFDDPNFGGPAIQDGEAAQSVAYLYGSALERYGMAAVSYADQLWRSAYAGPGAGSKRTESEKTQMLVRADEMLRQDVHAQFLAALPVAASLDDGAGGSVNEYQQAKITQARISVTDALRLREQILSGEKPTQTALVSAWDLASIGQQIGRCRDAHDAAVNKWSGSPPEGSVTYAIARSEQAQEHDANNEITLRNSLESQLVEITGIDPSEHGGLQTEPQRNEYLAAIEEKFLASLAAQDPNDPRLRDGSQMSLPALRIIQATREALAKKAQIDAFPQRVQVELSRNADVASTVVINGVEIDTLDAFTALANSVKIAVNFVTGPTVEYNPLWSVVAGLQQEKANVVRTQEITVNSINSEANIKNLLIEQQVAIAELPVIALTADIASAELRSLFAKANRLVEDHAFYREVTGSLWYRDPSLPFKLEKAEEEYRLLMHEYRIELYRLARMLEAAWTERFQNPVKKAGGTTVPLNNGSFDGFTEAESVFAVFNHEHGKNFFDALKAWDVRLRESDYRGPASLVKWDANSFSGQPISLRRDIYKFIDYRYDFDANTYAPDEALRRQSIQQFRALLLDKANRDEANRGGLSRLRLDFPLTYGQARVILGQANIVPIVQQNRPGGGLDQFWNHRVSQIGVKIVGKNVFAAGATVPVSFELFGNVDRIGFFPDSLYTSSRVITSFPVPLYQRDPDKRLVGEPFFGTGIGIPAAIGSTAVPMNEVTGWPLFCDNIVLRIGAQGTMRLENIEDIELYLKMEVGSPPPIPAGVW